MVESVGASAGVLFSSCTYTGTKSPSICCCNRSISIRCTSVSSPVAGSETAPVRRSLDARTRPSSERSSRCPRTRRFGVSGYNKRPCPSAWPSATISARWTSDASIFRTLFTSVDTGHHCNHDSGAGLNRECSSSMRSFDGSSHDAQ